MEECLDLLRDLDKDSSMTITKDELINGLKVVIIFVIAESLDLFRNLNKIAV